MLKNKKLMSSFPNWKLTSKTGAAHSIQGEKLMIEITALVWTFIAGIIVIIILSQCKTVTLKKLYLGIISLVSIVSSVTVFFVKPFLASKLAQNAYIDDSFIMWAIGKYNTFAKITIPVTIAIIIILVFVAHKTDKTSKAYKAIPKIAVIYMVGISFVSIWYGLGTVNKYFDLGSYISVIALCQAGIMFIPIVYIRIGDLKKQ